MILLRHGQSEFNVVFSATRTDPGIPDPRLTDLGRQQAKDAAHILAARAITRLVASPYTRTLETAEIVAAELDVPIIVEARVREHCFFTCDVGTRRSELSARWPNLSFDHLDEQWWPPSEEDEPALAARSAAFRADAAMWPDHTGVVVVSHWGFIRALTGIPTRNAECIPYDPR